MKAIMLCLVSGWFALTYSYDSARANDAQIDSTYRQRLDELATQLRVRKPKLEQGDYQLLIWERVSIMYGVAHKLYVLNKKKNSVRLTVYSMQYDKSRLKGFRRDVSNKKVSLALWQELVRHDVLNLPDMATLWRQIRKPSRRDTTSRVEVDSAGSVYVIANKYTNNHFMISDGTSFSFQVYGKAYYHDYGYSNPIEYARAYPEAADLQKAAIILYRLLRAFQE
jgi:hypothetical protein